MSLSTQLQLREGFDRHVKDIFGLVHPINTSALLALAPSQTTTNTPLQPGQKPASSSIASNPKNGGATAAAVSHVGFPLPMSTLWTLAKAVKAQAKDNNTNTNTTTNNNR